MLPPKSTPPGTASARSLRVTNSCPVHLSRSALARHATDDDASLALISRKLRLQPQRIERNAPFLQVQVRHRKLFHRIAADSAVLARVQDIWPYRNAFVHSQGRSARCKRHARTGQSSPSDHKRNEAAHARA